ncbi:MAG: serine hydrolase domain-containing protein [Planctomycetota bacterium]|nr:serine hydrolase domain-containing protein [Planctomycetota bacterium]
MRHAIVLLLLLPFAACGGGVGVINPIPGGPQLQGSCEGGPDVLMESDEQAYLQLGGAFDQLRHDEGPGNEPIKMTTKIDTWIRTHMCQNRIPGLALGIVWHGNLVYIKGYGLARGWETADASDDMPVYGQHTRFRWASISKCVTGLAAVMATKELGGNGQPLFDLDAPLQFNYRCAGDSCAYNLPNTHFIGWNEDLEEDDWPLVVESIPDVEDLYDFTPRRLFAHRCGVMHYSSGDPNAVAAGPTEQQKLENDGFVWAINLWSGHPLIYLPATGSQYSTFGTNMGGAALDLAVPGGFWGYVQSRIANATQPVPMQFFHPDDIYDAQYEQAPWNTDDWRVHGYTKNEQNDVVVNKTPHDVSWKLPGGGFISTVADMALFAHGLLNNVFLDQQGMDELWTPQRNIILGFPGTPTTGYALGFNVDVNSGERRIYHSGLQEDTRTRMILFPDGEDEAVGRLGIVVMTNAEYSSPPLIANQINDFLRNPYVEQGAVVFEGTLPRSLEWDQEDTAARTAPESGPFALDPDLFGADPAVYGGPIGPILQILPHTFDPQHDRSAPPVPSPDVIPEREDEGDTSRDDPPPRRR